MMYLALVFLKTARRIELKEIELDMIQLEYQVIFK